MDNFTFQNLAAAGQHVVNQQMMGQNIIQWPPQAVQNAAQTQQVLILAQQNPAVYVGPTGQLYTAETLRQQQWINCFPSTSQAIMDTTRDPWQVAQTAMEVAVSEPQVQYATVTQPLGQVTQTLAQVAHPLPQVTQQLTQVNQNTITDISQMYTDAELEAQAVAETLNHLRNQQMVNQHVDSPGHNSYGSSSNTQDPEPEASNEGGDWITIKIDPLKNQKVAGQHLAKDGGGGGKKKEKVKMETLQVAQVPIQSAPVPMVTAMQLQMMQQQHQQHQHQQQHQQHQGMMGQMHTASSVALGQPQQPLKIETTVQTIDIELMESLDPSSRKGNPSAGAVAAVAKKSKKKKTARQEEAGEEKQAEKKPRKGGADSKAGSYKCNECGALFAWARNLNRHMRKHTGQRPYACESCDATFTQNSHLKVHRLKHTGERPFVCKTCAASFTRSSYLNKHMLTHTTPPIKPKKKSKAAKEASKLAKLESEAGLTTISFPDALGMGAAAQTNGLKEGDAPKKKKKKKNKALVLPVTMSTQCQTTDEGALNLSTSTTIKQEEGFQQLEAAMAAAAGAGAELQVKPAVLRHTSQRHECKVCSATFLLMSSLSKHMLRHAQDKGEAFPCKHCQEVFTQADHLAQHMLKHTIEKKHVCVVCGEAFAKSATLAKHFMANHQLKPKAEEGTHAVYQPADS